MKDKILVIIPVSEPTLLKKTLADLRAWLDQHCSSDEWSYNIPLDDQSFDIHIYINEDRLDAAILFKLSCK